MNEVKMFKDIEASKLNKYPKDINKIFKKIFEVEGKSEVSMGDIDSFVSSVEVSHWKRILSQRSRSLLISYNAAMFYYDKGIYDDDFPKNHEKLNWENLINYHYFIENFFMTGSSILDNIAYILNAFYHMNFKDKIDFKKIIKDLSEENKYALRGTEDLISRLNDIKFDDRYRKFNDMRNNIAHNNPPLVLTSPITKLGNKGIEMGNGDYQGSREVQKVMNDFLEIYMEIIDILLNISKVLKQN